MLKKAREFRVLKEDFKMVAKSQNPLLPMAFEQRDGQIVAQVLASVNTRVNTL